VFFVDANIFLELLLGQERADECERFLRLVHKGRLRAVTTDFHVDTVIIVMENHGLSPADIRTFLLSLLSYEGLEIYILSMADRLEATKHMESLKLDFDDALAYQAMLTLNTRDIVSYDKHFDGLPGIRRITPAQILQG